MDQSSILGHSSSQAGSETAVPSSASAAPSSGNGSSIAAVSPSPANHSNGNAQQPLRFLREEGGRTMAAMAQLDLDAALQLLTERAQYITGASGAAIALRQGGQRHLLCRASTGSNAPVLGALLSTEAGLSAESVSARLPLRCDDAERDPRVNREGCRDLGIASVAVVPILSDDEVLGVFELFSGKINAFDERDVSTLQRLGEMVETAVKLAHSVNEPAAGPASETLTEAKSAPLQEIATEVVAQEPPGAHIQTPVAGILPPAAPLPQPLPDKESVPSKPLFWTAAASGAPAAAKPEPILSHLPAVLRNLHKCQACGFPVSEGRRLCVECEEKQWRGTLRPPAPAAPLSRPGSVPSHSSVTETRPNTPESAAAAPSLSTKPTVVAAKTASTPPAPASVSLQLGQFLADMPSSPSTAAPAPPISRETHQPKRSEPNGQLHGSAPSHSHGASGDLSGLTFLGGGGAPAESWFTANKYILAAILLVGIVIAIITLMR